jgi:transcription elongation factor GreB
MSKAFTSEEPADQGPVVREAPRLAPGEVRYVTPEGHAGLTAALAGARAALAELGALGEAERTARAPELARRVRLLEETLQVLTVLSPAAAPEGKAGFGCWVTVEDEAGEVRTWRLVGPDEADARGGLLSVHSPVGSALLGSEAGDEVTAERPGGAAVLTVVAVRRTAP